MKHMDENELKRLMKELEDMIEECEVNIRADEDTQSLLRVVEECFSRQVHELDEEDEAVVEWIVDYQLYKLLQLPNNELVEALVELAGKDYNGIVSWIPVLAIRAAMVRRLGYTDYGMIAKLSAKD